MSDETRTQISPGSASRSIPDPQTTARSHQSSDDQSADTAAGANHFERLAGSELEASVAQSAEAAAQSAAQSKTVADAALASTGYEILDEVGRGAMGVVYKARHKKLNRLVALKMTVEGRVREKDLIRFLAEAEAVAAVKHPNVVQVYDYGEAEGRPFMALEFCSGGSLAKRLEGDHPFAPAEAAEMLRRIAAGVNAAHEEGIVHRDLKPANVLLTEDDEPKVADFGIAKRTGRDLTATQAVMGTPFYMAPEQADGKAKFVGPPADVWALGVIFYECLSGQRPFSGETTAEVLAKVLANDPASLRAVNPDVPGDLELICRKCLEKNPADRYASAKELAEDLGRFAKGEPISVRPLGAAQRAVRWTRRNPVVAGLLAAVVLITLGLIGSLFAQYQQALTQVDTEREKNENADKARQEEIRRLQIEESAKNAQLQADQQARINAARAEESAKNAAAQAALANDLISILDGLFYSSDPLAGFFGDALPSFATSIANEGQIATLGPFLRNAEKRFSATLTDPSVALVRAKLLVSIGNGMKNLSMYPEGRKLLEEALALRRARLPETDPAVWQVELDLGRLEAESGDLLAAIERFRKVLALQKGAGADAHTILTTRLYEGITMSSVGLPEAGPVLREVVREREKLNGKVNKDTLLAKLALMTWLLERQEWKEVLALFADFSAGIRALPDVRLREVFDPILDCQSKLALANTARSEPLLIGSLRGAIDGMKKDIGRLEKVLPPDHIITTVFRFELAKLLLHVGDTREADELFARILVDARRTVGLSHPKALNFLDVYVDRLVANKRLPEARALFDEMEKANRKRFGDENPWLTMIFLQRAAFEQQQGDADKSLAAAKEASALMRRGKFLPTAGALNDLYEAARALGVSRSKPLQAAARDLFVALRPLVGKVHGEASAEMVVVLYSEGKQLYDAGDRAGAAVPFELALAQLHAVPDLLPIKRVNVLYWNGRIAMDRGKFADAERHFRDLRAAAKKVPDYSTADREEDSLYLARALSAQGKYAGAVPLFEEAQRHAAKLNRPEQALAWSDMQVAVAQLAAGEWDAYLKSLQRMFEKYGKSSSVDVLSRLAWVGGLSAKPQGWNPVEFAATYKAAYKPNTTFAWGYRGLALVCLRAGDFAGVEAALTKAGKVPLPVDHLIRGLVAIARNDPTTARAQLAKAEELIEAAKPTEQNPFAYANRSWNQLPETAILLAELRAALAPAAAPAPRPKG